MNPSLLNITKFGGSILTSILAEILIPCGSVAVKGVEAATGFDTGEFCKELIKAVSGNFTHQFANEINYSELLNAIKNNKEALNHDIEKLMIASLPKAIQLLEDKYFETYEKDKSTIAFFEQLKIDATEKPYDSADYLLMMNARDQWLGNIKDYIFTVNEYKIPETVENYFNQYFSGCFQLVFIEGLKNPKDEKPLKAFLIKTLTGLEQQTNETRSDIAELKQEILSEIAELRAEKKSRTIIHSQAYFEKIYSQLAELLLITKRIEVNVIRAVENTDKILDKLDTFKTETPKTTKPLTDIPALGTFIGREDDLKKLTQTLEQSKQVVLVNGIGGIGKTTLAKAYVEARKADFDHIAWINVLGDSTQEAFVTTNYIDDALNQAKFTQSDTDVRFGAIMKVLKQLQGKGLLVIDNAETDIEDISQDLPTLNWNVLLTSRDNLDGYQTLPLDELSPDDALVLFKTYYKGKASDHDLHALLKTIDYHTLTIELLAKTLEKSDDEFDLAVLQDKLTKRQLDDERLARTIKTEHRNAKQTQLFKHLLATFELSEKHRSPDEIWVLKQFAALPPEPQAIKTLREWLKIDESTKVPFAQAIENLHTTGWLRKTRNEKGETCYTLHRLIQDMVQYQHPISYEDVCILVETFYEFLRFDAHTNFATKFQYLNSAEAILNSLPEEVENSQIALLSNNIGVVYRNFADYKKAVKYLEKSLIIRENQKEESEIATIQSNLAIVYRYLGEYNKAANLGEKALKSDIQNFGESHPKVTIRQSNLALVYKDLGEYEKAANLGEKALKSDIQNFGESHPNVTIRLSNLAIIYRYLGEFIKATNLLEKALKSSIKYFEESHPKVATLQSNLALVYKDCGEYTKAADLLEKALKFDLQNFGESHPKVATRQLNLATVLVDLKRVDEAYILLEKAYATRVLRLGTEHPSTKNCLSWFNKVKGMLG